jgi:hypothetical protein
MINSMKFLMRKEQLRLSEFKLGTWERMYLEGFKISREGANGECLIEEHLGHNDFHQHVSDEAIWKILEPYYKTFMDKFHEEMGYRKI